MDWLAELTDMQTRSGEVFDETEGIGEMDEELPNSAKTASDLKPIGNQNMKQWSSDAGYLQEALHHLLFGDMQEAKMGSGRLLTKDMRHARQEGLEWRSSSKIRQQVMEREVIIYAVLRCLPEPASESGQS